MPERLNGTVSKTVAGVTSPRVRIPVPPPIFSSLSFPKLTGLTQVTNRFNPPPFFHSRTFIFALLFISLPKMLDRAFGG